MVHNCEDHITEKRPVIWIMNRLIKSSNLTWYETSQYFGNQNEMMPMFKIMHFLLINNTYKNIPYPNNSSKSSYIFALKCNLEYHDLLAFLTNYIIKTHMIISNWYFFSKNPQKLYKHFLGQFLSRSCQFLCTNLSILKTTWTWLTYFTAPNFYKNKKTR